MPTKSLRTSLMESLDNAWDPLIARTQDLSEAEYAWLPAPGAWTVRLNARRRWHADWDDEDPDPAPVTSISWRCWHIGADCLDSYSTRLWGATGLGLATTSWVGTWGEAKPILEKEWEIFRSGVAAWDEERLLTALGPTWGPYAQSSHLDLALHAQREIIHHGAEIALLRDLYRARVTESAPGSARPVAGRTRAARSS
jgi:DinB superfamily